MKKDKIKADNVEELMEIVRAIQRGEEPTQESIRRNTESVPEADSPEPYSREDAEWEDGEAFRSSKDGDEEDEEDSGFHPVRWLRAKKRAAAETEETASAGRTEKESGAEETASAGRTEKESGAEETASAGRTKKRSGADETASAGRTEKGPDAKKRPSKKESDAEPVLADDEWDEDDEFTRILNGDGDGVSAKDKGSELTAGVLGTVSGLFASGAKRASGLFSSGAKRTSDRSGAEKKNNSGNAEDAEKPKKSGPSLTGETADVPPEGRKAGRLSTRYESAAHSAGKTSDSGTGAVAEPEQSGSSLTGQTADVSPEGRKADRDARPQPSHRVGLLRRDSILYDPDDEDEEPEESEMALDPESRDVFERIAGKRGIPARARKESEYGAGSAENGAQGAENSSPETARSAQSAENGAQKTRMNRPETERGAQSSKHGAQGAENGSPETGHSAQKTEDDSPETGHGAQETEDDSPETGYGAQGTESLGSNPQEGASNAQDSTRTQAEEGTSANPSDEEDEAIITVAQPKRRRRKTAAEKEEELRKGLVPQRRTLSDYLTAGKDYVSDVLAELREKGISRREFAMLGAVAVFVILLIVAAVNAVSGSIEQKRKSEHVTADDGLCVTVEAEPETWSARYPVQLKFSASGAQIKQIRINGEVCSPDEDGIVTVQAEDYLLEAAVETDQGTKTARIEIPKLDGDAPVVHAVRKDGKIELTAVDGRSLVSGIYYAAYQESPWNEIPVYLKYMEPIVYIEGMTYRFFAEDAAGNRSVPVTTTMEEATGLTLAKESLSLYPGESGEIKVQAEPAGALLNNLKYESLNPELLSVEGSGRVTAIAEGTGTVRVSADGVAPVICTVMVADSRTVTVGAVGDCTLGTDESFNTMTNFNAFDSVNGHSYFFSKVKDILSGDDVTFANLEGTFTTATTREQKEYAFKGDPSYAEILPLGSIEVVTLANNHSSDYGEQSLTDTKHALEEAGVDYCMGDTIAFKEVNGIQTAFIGIYVLEDGMERESQVRQTIASAQAQGAQLIIVAFHWGSEKASEPDATQISLAHTAIDCGADLVVGHHPHVLQGIERYNGKYIAYSLGNFCFGGNSAPSDTDTMILQQTFNVTRSGTEPAKLTVVPCSISSDTGYNNYQPTPVEGDRAASIIERINDLSAAYGVTVGSDGTVLDAAEPQIAVPQTDGTGETDPA